MLFHSTTVVGFLYAGFDVSLSAAPLWYSRGEGLMQSLLAGCVKQSGNLGEAEEH